MRPSVTSPTGTVIGAPVSITSRAARQAVGGVHRDRAHAVVAEVLLDLAHEHVPPASRLIPAASSSARRPPARDRDRVVDLGQAVGEHGLDHDALDLLDAPDVGVRPFRLCRRSGRLCGSRVHFLIPRLSVSPVEVAVVEALGVAAR